MSSSIISFPFLLIIAVVFLIVIAIVGVMLKK